MTLPNAPGARGDGYAGFARNTFLVIDDFSGMRNLLITQLRACGANLKMIESACDGREALAMLARRRYDVVLCDFNLGAGKNGMQVLEEAHVRKLIGPACSWIMVTAEKTADMVMCAAEAQPDAYLVKPITEFTLTNRIRKIKAKKESFIDIDRAVAANDLATAIRLCDERAARDKANAADLLRVKCDLLVQSGESGKAQQAYAGILAAAKHDVPWAQIGLARVEMQAGNLEAARERLEQLIDRNHGFLAAYDRLAETYLALGEHGKAEDILDRAVALSPFAHGRQRAIGEVYLKTGKLERAEQAFRMSIRLAENSATKSPAAHLALARTIGARDDAKEALKVLDEMCRQFDCEEARIRAKSVAGLIHHRNGDAQQAREAAREISAMLERSPGKIDSTAAKEMAELMLAAGERDQGMALLKAEVMNNPDDKEHLESVRSIFVKTGLVDEGSDLVESSRREAIEMMNEGTLLATEGKYEQAVAMMRTALDKMPHNVRLLLNFAHITITHMEKNGTDAPLMREARQNLLAANLRAGGGPRCHELMARLQALAQPQL